MGLWDDVVGPKGYHLYREHKGSALGIPIPPGGRLADLFALDTDFILELYVPDDTGAPQLVSAVAFPYHPETMQISRDAATQVTPTLGYLPVREHSLTRQLSIRLKGRSGVRPRQGHDREGAIVTRSGPDLAREFDAFLDRYQRMCHDHAVFYRTPETALQAATRSAIGGPYLVFRSFTNGIHIRVEPRNWTLTRDAQNSRFGFSWFLDLQGYAPADPTNPPRLFGAVQDVFKFAAECINAASSVVSLAGTAVDRATELANSGRVALQAAATAAATFGDVMSSVNDLTNVPAGDASDLANILTEAENAVSDFLSTQRAEGASADPALTGARATVDEIRDMEATLAGLTRAAIAAVSLAGVTGGRVTTGASGAARRAPTRGAVAVSEVPVARYRRRPGAPAVAVVAPDEPTGIVVPLPDYGSLEGLSARYYGTPRLWTRIAEANRMRSAYTLADGSPLVAGTRLLIPLTTTQLQAAQVAPGQSMTQDPYAHDLYLDPVTGDLEITGGNQDVRTIRGAANLEQAIRVRLRSTQGGSSPYPAFGMPDEIGTGVRDATAGYIASQLHDQLTRDPRVLTLNRVAIADDGDQVTAYVEVQPITGTSVDVLVPI